MMIKKQALPGFDRWKRAQDQDPGGSVKKGRNGVGHSFHGTGLRMRWRFLCVFVEYGKNKGFCQRKV
jgi:hypothetical protein